MPGDRPLPVGGIVKVPTVEHLRRLCGAAFLTLAATCIAAGAVRAEDVPTPRPSPLKATTSSEDALLATGDAPPAFAEEDFEPVQSSAALEAATAVGRNHRSASHDAGGNGALSLVPPSDNMITAQQAFPDEAPIDLTAPTFDNGTPGEDQAVLGSYTLEARMTADSPPLESGVVWRVFANDGEDGKMRLVGEADGGPVTLRLKPGEYFVHAAFGRAGLTRKVTVAPTPRGESIVLDAGGMRLTALAGKDRQLNPDEVRFDIYAPDEGGSEGRIAVLENAPAGTVIALNAGIYHVVCRYGDANAIVRADIKIEAGKLTEAALYQQAARVTLKLVENHGGEALANTQWLVVTSAGESVAESVGAFPSVVLLAGEYTAIAKHEDRIFEQKFTVESGLNRDVEVLQQQTQQ